jgi:hypothetical protein
VKKLVSKFAFQVHNLQRYTAGANGGGEIHVEGGGGGGSEVVVPSGPGLDSPVSSFAHLTHLTRAESGLSTASVASGASGASFMSAASGGAVHDASS